MSRYLLERRRGEPKKAVPKLLLKTVVQMGAAALLIFRYNEGVAPWMKWSLGILSLLWALLSLFQYFFVGTRAKMLLAQAKGSGDFWKEHRLDLTGEGLRLSFGEAKLEIPFAEISEFAETEDLYLVFRGRDVFELVPKRAAGTAFPEEIRECRSRAKRKRTEELRASLLSEAPFARYLSLSREELAAGLALAKKRSLRHACGWSGFMVFSLGFPLVLAVYSAAAGAWPTAALCLLAFALFNLRLFIIFTSSYRKLIEGRLAEPGEDGYLLAVKDKTVWLLAEDSGTTYSLDKLKLKERTEEGLFLFFEKQNLFFVPLSVSDAFEVAAGLRKSIRERAAAGTGASGEEE